MWDLIILARKKSAFIALIMILPFTTAMLPLRQHGIAVGKKEGTISFTSPPAPAIELQQTPTPFPTPTKVYLKGFYTYQDPSNLFFITLPETAKKLPGDRPTIFQFQEDELLMIFQKEYLTAPQRSDLEDLAEGLLFVLVEQNNLGEQSQLLSVTLEKDTCSITASYLTPAQQWGKAFFSFKISGTSLLGIMFVSPSPQADELWKTMISSFTLVRALSTPLPITSNLESLSVLGGNSLTLPNEVRALYRVSSGIYYQLADYDYSLARLGTQKAIGSGRFPKDFIMRSQISWWTAPGPVSWKEAGCGYIFRYVDKNNYYSINWSLDGKVYLKRKTKGYETLAFEAPYPNLRQARGTGKIMLAISDTQVVAFYNDKRVFRMVDSPLNGSMKSGEVGLVVFSGTNVDFGTRCQFTQNELWEVNQP
jgi:hypothetical protein